MLLGANRGELLRQGADRWFDRRRRRRGGRDCQRGVLYLESLLAECGVEVVGRGKSVEAPHPHTAHPNKRLHLTPRRGHRGIDLSHL